MSLFELKRQNRKTLSVTVKSGKVTVSAPMEMPVSDIEKFLDDKAEWISKKLSEYRRKQDMYSNVLEYKTLLVEGREYPVIVSDKVKRTTINNDEFLLPQKYNDNERRKKIMGLFIKKNAQTELKKRLDEISDFVKLPYREFSLTNATGKWGSCDGKNNIMLNWRLYMLKSYITDYVIIHELCHTIEHNHSPKFWSKVASFYPEYKKIKKELKECSVVNELFR